MTTSKRRLSPAWLTLSADALEPASEHEFATLRRLRRLPSPDSSPRSSIEDSTRADDCASVKYTAHDCARSPPKLPDSQHRHSPKDPPVSFAVCMYSKNMHGGFWLRAVAAHCLTEAASVALDPLWRSLPRSPCVEHRRSSRRTYGTSVEPIASPAANSNALSVASRYLFAMACVHSWKGRVSLFHY